MIKPVKIGALVVASALALAACGGSSDSGSGDGGKSFVIATDLPLQGSVKDTSDSTNNAIALYLEQIGGKAGDYNITLKFYDNATAAKGAWDDAQCAKNAQEHVAAVDEIAVMGAFNSGCAKIIVPVLNQDPTGPMLMISHANTNPGLTKTWDAGEPAKYYPTGKRNFARVVAADDVQGMAAAQYLASEKKVTKCAVIDDKATFGQGLAQAFEGEAAKQGIEIVVKDSFDAKQPNYVAMFQKIKAAGADCLYISADYTSNGGQVIKDAVKVLGSAKDFVMMASNGYTGYADMDALAESEGLLLTFTGLSIEGITKLGGVPAKFIADYKTKYGKDVDGAWALNGVGAFQALLSAVAQSGGTRAGAVDAVFGGKVTIPANESVMGVELGFDSNGDLASKVVTVQTVTGGKEIDLLPWTVK